MSLKEQRIQLVTLGDLGLEIAKHDYTQISLNILLSHKPSDFDTLCGDKCKLCC